MCKHCEPSCFCLCSSRILVINATANAQFDGISWYSLCNANCILVRRISWFFVARYADIAELSVRLVSWFIDVFSILSEFIFFILNFKSMNFDRYQQFSLILYLRRFFFVIFHNSYHRQLALVSLPSLVLLLLQFSKLFSVSTGSH